ncbi:hypothetical protein SDC9_195402 [bioreactor metagenome]|uniref:Uncharacterized protein n=1 Tax=bioreactor metagenome TaxID=1076179 RepID=A0A645I973_9ZZZZ
MQALAGEGGAQAVGLLARLLAEQQTDPLQLGKEQAQQASLALRRLIEIDRRDRRRAAGADLILIGVLGQQGGEDGHLRRTRQRLAQSLAAGGDDQCDRLAFRSMWFGIDITDLPIAAFEPLLQAAREFLIGGAAVGQDDGDLPCPRKQREQGKNQENQCRTQHAITIGVCVMPWQ